MMESPPIAGVDQRPGWPRGPLRFFFLELVSRHPSGHQRAGLFLKSLSRESNDRTETPCDSPIGLAWGGIPSLQMGPVHFH